MALIWNVIYREKDLKMFVFQLLKYLNDYISLNTVLIGWFLTWALYHS